MRTSIVWKGTSMLDGRTPIQVLLVPDSGNAKTGPMWQTYIIRADITPLAAIKARDTRATCGTCPLQQGGCYAERMQGLISLGRTMEARGYPEMPLGAACAALAASGSALRIGAYGDPAAVPVAVWDALTAGVAKGWTGYTHQWRTCDQSLRRYIMASCDTELDADDAQAMGWRTFRVRQVTAGGAIEPTRSNELICPASHERDMTTCEHCRLCDGHGRGSTRRNVAIIDHSTRALAIRRRVAEIAA
jgi:hypothetical protein